MSRPAVSVVIPTYNYARFLPRALDSVLRQTVQDFEILLIDDGSTDDTPAVVAPYLADRRLVYRHTANGGPARARNVGIRLARAPLVAFLDADDAWHPAKLERQLECFRRDPDLGLVYCQRRWLDDAGRELPFPRPVLYRGHVALDLLRGSVICLSTCVVPRRVLDRVGLFDEGLTQSEDYDLWLRVAEQYRFDYVNEVLADYRVGHVSLSSRVEERLPAVLFIVRRFARRTGLPHALLRRKLAQVYGDFGFVLRQRSRLRALPWYCKAVWVCPGRGHGWAGLLSLFLPDVVRRMLRRSPLGPLTARAYDPR
jgi:glycosyltransferase involved in cell wall biosynthesis